MTTLLPITDSQQASQHVYRAQNAVVAAEVAFGRASRQRHRRQASQKPSVRQRAWAEATDHLDTLAEAREHLAEVVYQASLFGTRGVTPVYAWAA